MAVTSFKLSQKWTLFMVSLYAFLLQVHTAHGYAPILRNRVGMRHVRVARGSSSGPQATSQEYSFRLSTKNMKGYSQTRLYYIEYDDEEEGSGGKPDEDDEGDDAIEQKAIEIVKALGSNPLIRIFTNSYSFFWNFPKKTMPYDTPWLFLRNSSAEFISWYQFPHNLPPYRYVGEEMGFRSDMFAYGLPGNTLPLGNWDPFGFQCVDKKMLMKYRESELKHGRLAMLACLGFIVQEISHPLHNDIGGMAITHMAQLQHLGDRSSIFKNLHPPIRNIEGILSRITGTAFFEVNAAIMPDGVDSPIGDTYPFISVDYIFVVGLLAVFELSALAKHWTRWRPDEYNHQFEHNMGVGNLRNDYVNGDYGFDVLGLMPKGARSRRRMVERELNHGRLAMIAIIGMIGQEYLTGISVYETAFNLLVGEADNNLYTTTNPSMFDQIMRLPSFVLDQMSQAGMGIEPQIPQPSK